MEYVYKTYNMTAADGKTHSVKYMRQKMLSMTPALEIHGHVYVR